MSAAVVLVHTLPENTVYMDYAPSSISKKSQTRSHTNLEGNTRTSKSKGILVETVKNMGGVY